MMTIIKGTDNTIAINFTETETNTPLDLTGYTILFTVKTKENMLKDDSVAIIKKEITYHEDPTHGKSNLFLTNVDTNIKAGQYRWDLRLIKDSLITQTKSDSLEIVEGVTKRVL